LRDFERKGTQWLELMRNWILEANQAAKLSQTDNFDEMRNFLQGIGSNRRIAAGIWRGHSESRGISLRKFHSESAAPPRQKRQIKFGGPSLETFEPPWRNPPFPSILSRNCLVQLPKANGH
jgi:hypothetical protein